MKTKLQKAIFLGALALMGAQVTTAQNPTYSGIPFGGTATPIGTAVGAGDKLELENYDSVAGTPEGVNYGAAPTNGVVGTYWDKSSGNTGDNSYRSGSDVDLSTGGSGVVITGGGGNVGGEYQFYTINVLSSGTYNLSLNYNVGGGNKSYQVFLHQTNNVEAPNQVLYNATGANALAGTSGAFIDSPDSPSFTLTAGTWLIKAVNLSFGPSLDYITFTLNPTLGVDNNQVKANKLKAYPNPSNDGRFNLSKSHKWEVYSILGAKVINGEGKTVNLSAFSRGMYVLKVESGITKSLIYK